MDRRIAQRRHWVTEQRATMRLKAVIGLVVLAALLAAGLWIVRSPLLSIDEVTITGASKSNPGSAIEQLGITTGMPTISVDAAALETVLLADPWIAEARATVTWPGSLEIEVVEHVPVALVQIGDGFAHVTADGVMVQRLDDPAGWPVIATAEAGAPRAGDVLGGPALLGAIEFIAALPPAMASTTTVSIDSALRLGATVGEFPVRLGRPIDMAAKAAALVAVIEHGVEPGVSIDVTAPRRPAVAEPSS